MTITVRIYQGKDVEMLLSCSTITESGNANKAFLISKRSTWADPFFPNLKERIDLAVKNHLGVDSAKDLRLATDVVLSLQSSAVNDLRDFRAQVMQDFRADQPRRTEIFTQLGFQSYYTSMNNGDQEGLINLLFQFNTNMTPALKTEISDKGTAAALIDSILTYAVVLRNANITQEGFKGDRKVITAAALAEFNGVYDEVISMAKIATRFFKDQPELKEKFSYNKVRKALNAYR